MIAKKFGPEVGGLFLAFPAIFPATATLLEKHEKQKKQRKGLNGTKRGRLAAGVDAAGAAMGAGRHPNICADRMEIAAGAIRFDSTGGGNVGMGSRCDIHLGSGRKNKATSTQACRCESYPQNAAPISVAIVRASFNRVIVSLKAWHRARPGAATRSKAAARPPHSKRYS